MTITTGYGYYTQNGNIIAKYVLPVGNHPDPAAGITYTEVANQAALNAVTIYVAPLTPAQAFNVDTFVAALFTSFSADSGLFPYYAVLKDLAVYKNFAGMNSIVNGLVLASIITNDEQTTLNTILATQNIVLSTFTS